MDSGRAPPSGRAAAAPARVETNSEQRSSLYVRACIFGHIEPHTPRARMLCTPALGAPCPQQSSKGRGLATGAPHRRATPSFGARAQLAAERQRRCLGGGATCFFVFLCAPASSPSHRIHTTQRTHLTPSTSTYAMAGLARSRKARIREKDHAFFFFLFACMRPPPSHAHSLFPAHTYTHTHVHGRFF